MARAFARLAAPLPSVLALVLGLCAVGACGSSDGDDADTQAGAEAGAFAADAVAPADDGASDAASDAPATSDGASDAGDAGPKLDAALDADADAGVVDPGPPAVRFIGRFDTTPAAGPRVGFPHAQIIARFSGPEVKATFADAMVYTDYGPTRWEVLVDGVSQMVLSIARAQTQYTLAQGLGAGPHTVELVKLTEASVGISQFLGFDFPGGALLPPPPAATRHLEFLGDSASNGYGVDGVNPCGFSGATENARKSYPALVAADLSADHHNLGASGKGLYWNYYRPDLDVFSVLYPRSLPFTNGSTFDFTTYTPDVVWMTLGGNDYSRDNPGDPAPPFASFEAKYDEMVTTIRTKRPNALVVCAVAPSLTNVYPAGYNAYTNVKTAATNVVAAKVGAGDAKLHVFEFTRSLDGDLTACDGHPNAAKHRAMADEAVAFIKSKTGWL